MTLPPPNQQDMPLVHAALLRCEEEVREADARVRQRVPALRRLAEPSPPEERERAWERLRDLRALALLDGAWEPWVAEARRVGQVYLDHGVRWSDWLSVHVSWRPVVFREIGATLDGELLLRALLAADTFTDVTVAHAGEAYMQRRSSQLRAANRDLDAFAYVASHDLRAPLRGVDNLTTWLREELDESVGGDLSEGAREYLRLIEDRVARLDAMIAGLLDYSRAGKAVEPESVRVGELFEELVAELARDDGYRFELDAPEALEVPVTLAPLRSALQNLMCNARKHRGEGRRCVVRFRRLLGALRVIVDDDGPGIPEEHRERARGMFETLRPRDELAATGMGLAIVDKQVAAFGGGLALDASPLGGLRAAFDWHLGTGG